MDKKSFVNDLYHASILSGLAIGYSMLGSKILKIGPPSLFICSLFIVDKKYDTIK